MEWLRSCYKSTWRLFQASAQTVRGRYFFAPKGTPFYPGAHNLWSKQWVSDEMDPPPELGEVGPVIQRWDRGDPPPAGAPAVLVGGEQCIREGGRLPLPVFTPPRTFPAGIDSRCYLTAGLPVPFYALNPGAGGEKIGGSSAPQTPFRSTSVGGQVIGGASELKSPIQTVGVGGQGKAGFAIAIGVGVQWALGGQGKAGIATGDANLAQEGTGGQSKGGSAKGQPKGAAASGKGGQGKGGTGTSSHSP